MIESELKKCPRCGSEAGLGLNDLDYAFWGYCSSCNAIGLAGRGGRPEENRAQAISNWNAQMMQPED